LENCYYNNVRYDVVRVVEVSIVFSLIFLVGLMGVQSSFAIPESFAQEEGMCAPQNYKRIVKNAGAIFTGTVISKEPLMRQYFQNVHFKIDELLLGDYENFVNVTTSERRTVGSEPRGGDPFEVGEKYMVFAGSIENNTLYAGSSGCGDSLVIPMLSGLFGFGVGKNCSASVHLECLDRCGINFSSYGNTAECLQVCYKRNSDQCQLKPEPISEPEKDTSEQIDSNLPPLKQISSGTLPENVTCTEGLKLIFKYDNSPACVKPSTAQKLLERGWTKLGYLEPIRVDTRGTWGIGENLQVGDYFSYRLCHKDYQECLEFEIDFWIEKENEEKWTGLVLVVDGNRILLDEIEIKNSKIISSSLSSKSKSYLELFNNSVLALSRFATTNNEDGAVGPKSFSEESWGRYAKISGAQVIPTAIENVTVKGGTFESVLITFSPFSITNKVWVVDEFPFPVKADVWSEVDTPIQEYKFELLAFENTLEDPFHRVVSSKDNQK